MPRYVPEIAKAVGETNMDAYRLNELQREPVAHAHCVKDGVQLMKNVVGQWEFYLNSYISLYQTHDTDSKLSQK